MFMVIYDVSMFLKGRKIGKDSINNISSSGSSNGTEEFT